LVETGFCDLPDRSESALDWEVGECGKNRHTGNGILGRIATQFIFFILVSVSKVYGRIVYMYMMYEHMVYGQVVYIVCRAVAYGQVMHILLFAVGETVRCPDAKEITYSHHESDYRLYIDSAHSYASQLLLDMFIKNHDLMPRLRYVLSHIHR